MSSNKIIFDFLVLKHLFNVYYVVHYPIELIWFIMSFMLEPDIQVSCGMTRTFILHRPTGKVIVCAPYVLDINQFLMNIPNKIKFVGSGHYGLVAYDINNTRHELNWYGDEGNEYIKLSSELKSIIVEKYLPNTISYGSCYKLFLCRDNKLYILGKNKFMGIKPKHGLKLIKFPDCPDDVKIIQIGSSSRHSFVLTMNGLYSWGGNSNCELGLGDSTNYKTPIKINLTNIVFFSFSAYHAMALDSNNSLWSWGSNNYGALGLGPGDRNNRGIPQKLELRNIISVACGTKHTIALDSNGNVYGWGYNLDGQLGLGDGRCSSSPQKIELRNIVSVTCGANHTIAIDIYSNIYGWGANGSGQLGLNGSGQLGLNGSGQLGLNGSGQLGLNENYFNQHSPQLLELKF